MKSNEDSKSQQNVIRKPDRKMSKEELYVFAAECCRYVEKKKANEKEYIIVH